MNELQDKDDPTSGKEIFAIRPFPKDSNSASGFGWQYGPEVSMDAENYPIDNSGNSVIRRS
jgi:hypothetical protein